MTSKKCFQNANATKLVDLYALPHSTVNPKTRIFKCDVDTDFIHSYSSPRPTYPIVS